MANYIVEPALLKPYLPPYTQLDFYNGNTYVSLVGFMFNNTSILGVKVPFHVNFEEVNLRFYVRYNDNGAWKRGVVFVKEIVPKRAIAFVANNLYHEKYATMKMTHFIKYDDQAIHLGYHWKDSSRLNKLEVIALNKAHSMSVNSEEEFIAQHYWGYSKYNDQTTFMYEVRHPLWNIYPIKKYVIDCDFAMLYGKAFSFLEVTTPSSVFLADGSKVSILHKRNAKPLNAF